MANQADIARAQRGRDEWNTWAEENPGNEVNFSNSQLKRIDFAGFVFPGKANFGGVSNRRQC